MPAAASNQQELMSFVNNDRYTGTQDGDPSSILHTAYETTVNETPVTAEHHTEITIQQQEHKN